jgi:glycerol-3-phosphate acyltransferase PlsY
MKLIYLAIVFICGYLIGSIPFGYIVGKANHIDIRKFGSGNIGATNVARKLGFFKGFLVVGLLDFLKSYLFITAVFSSTTFSFTEKLILSFSPIVGHVFSVFLNFKGGKGVSCTYGLLAALFGWKFTFFWFLIWMVLLLISRLMSFTNLLMSLSFPYIFWLYFHSISSTVMGLVLTLIIFITHRHNIKKLLKGEENKL